MLQINGQLSHFHNTRANASETYSEELQSITSLAKSRIAVDSIKSWPGYEETPLYNLSSLSKSISVDKIWYKDESKRFGLKSFKALGGAYAVFRQLQIRIEQETGQTADIHQILKGDFNAITRQVVISCATDGNHGRSVSWGCQMFGCPCIIYIHRDVSIGRQQAMEAFGAEVVRIKGNYDESVKTADSEAQQHGRCIVSDTSYEGYMDIPRDVALGYTVMLEEAVNQMNGDIPTHVFVQGGVGGVASAVCAYFWELWGDKRPRMIIVEPEQANCLQESARAGHPVAVEGDLDTLMAGLACGEVSALAWEILKNGANDFLTISEESVPDTMKLLAKGYEGDAAIEAGESAVAGLGALICARSDQTLSDSLSLDENSKIFIIGTEGATDAELYEQLINS